jgi:hypothetical protein
MARDKIDSEPDSGPDSDPEWTRGQQQAKQKRQSRLGKADPALAAAADQAGLGGFVQHHDPASANKGHNKTIMLMGAAVVGIALLVLILGIVSPSQMPEEVSKNIQWVYVMSGIGLLIILAGGIGLLLVGKNHLQLHEQGFVLSGNPPVAVPYAAVTSLKMDVTRVTDKVGTYYRGTIETKLQDGRAVRVNPALEDIEEVMGALTSGTFDPISNSAYQAAKAGQTVAFGKIVLNPQGVQWGGKGLATWNEISRCSEFDGELSLYIRRNGKNIEWKRIRAASTPNVSVLEKLVGRLANEGGGGGHLPDDDDDDNDD